MRTSGQMRQVPVRTKSVAAQWVWWGADKNDPSLLRGPAKKKRTPGQAKDPRKALLPLVLYAIHAITWVTDHGPGGVTQGLSRPVVHFHPTGCLMSHSARLKHAANHLGEVAA